MHQRTNGRPGDGTFCYYVQDDNSLIDYSNTVQALVDTTPYGATFGAGDSAPIPREDLPFGLPDWHGTGGATRSQRSGDKIINWTSPL